MMKKVSSLLMVLGILISFVSMMNIQTYAAYENTWVNTGNQRKDIVEIAKTQLGYTEGSGNNNKYGSYFGANYKAWCAYFVSWCAAQANIDDSIIHRQGIASPFYGYFNIPNSHGTSSYFPSPGDLVFYGPNSNGDHYHVGIVETVNSSTGYITTIEGNTNSNGSSEGYMVCRQTRHYQASNICCYGYPNYQGNGADKVNVAEGVYIIQNVRDNNMVLDIQHNSTASGANIQLYENVNTTVQKFKIVDKGDYYCIQSVYSGNWLDIASPYSDDFCNIQLWDRNDRTEQHWTFEDAGGGNVYIRSDYGAYIDTYNGGMSNGTNVNTFHFDGTTSQQWTLIRVSPYEKMTVADGVYFIRNVRDSGKCLDIQYNSTEVGANVMLYENLGNKIQKFRVVNKGNYCCIQSVYSGNWLDIASPYSDDECNIQLWDRNDRREQHWVFENAGNGKVLIRSCYGAYVDCESGKTANGTNISTFHYDASTSQQWTLVKTTEKPTATLAVDSANYITTDEVKFSFGGNNSGTYTLGLYKDGNRIDTVTVKGNTYKRSFSETGSYSAYMTAYSSPDYADSNWVNWTVYDKPTKPVITGITPNSNGTVTVEWTKCETNTRSYSLRFYKNGNASEEILLNRVTTDTHYTYDLPDGNYTVMVTAEGMGGFTHSEKSSLFTIKKNVVRELVLSAQQNKELLLGSNFADKDLRAQAVYTDSTQKDVTDSVTIFGYDKTKAGEQTITVSYEENGVQVSANYKVTVLTPAQAADVDEDGAVTVDDLSQLLLADNYGAAAGAAQNRRCDTNRDGIVDFADMSLILNCYAQ